MATDKKSFILYCDQRGTWERLSNEQAGKLIKHVLAYVNDENPEADFITELAFEGIKRALKADLIKYEQIKAKRIESGRKGGKQTQANQASATSAKANQAVNVNGNVSVTVNGTVITKEVRELTFREQVAQHTTFDAVMLDEFADYWTESNPKGKKLKFELQKTFDIARRLKKWSSNNFNTSKESTMELPTEYPKNSWDN